MESLLDPGGLGDLDENDPVRGKTDEAHGQRVRRRAGRGVRRRRWKRPSRAGRLAPKEICKRPLTLPEELHLVVNEAYDGRRLAPMRPPSITRQPDS